MVTERKNNRQERVLIIKLGALGDVIQCEGAYHTIRAHHPEAHIIVMTSQPYQTFFERCPWVDEVFIDNRSPRWNLPKMLALRKQMRALDIDMVYDLQQVKRTQFYFRRFMRNVPWMGKAEGCRYQFPPVPGKSGIDQYSDQLNTIGVNHNYTLQSNVGWMADDMNEYLERRNVASPFAVLITGASSGHDEKRWPYYDKLGALIRDRGIVPVTVPGPDELALSRSYRNIKVLTDDNGRFLDFFKLAGILKEASFAVGNDTGPVHIAANLGIPGLSLYSRHSTPMMTGIQHSRFNWIEVDDLDRLPVEEVWRSVEDRLIGSR